MKLSRHIGLIDRKWNKEHVTALAADVAYRNDLNVIYPKQRIILRRVLEKTPPTCDKRAEQVVVDIAERVYGIKGPLDD